MILSLDCSSLTKPLENVPFNQTRGLLLVVEGCDRVGKTTQCELLNRKLKETYPLRDFQIWKFPDRTTPIGKLIDSYLQGKIEMCDEAIHLLFSANRWELKAAIISTLESGTTIILDRYTTSGLVYSVLKGLDLDWCKSPDINLPVPDFTIFLDLPPEISAQRKGYGEERYEKIEIQKAARELFISTLHQSANSTIIDGNQTIEEVSEKVYAGVLAYFAYIDIITKTIETKSQLNQ